MDESLDQGEYIDRIYNMLNPNPDTHCFHIKSLESFVINQGMQISPQELESFFNDLSPDAEGMIKEHTFKAEMAKILKEDDEDEVLTDVFRILDREHDGELSVGELKYALYCLGERVTDDEVKTLMNFVADDKETISLEDFKKLARACASRNN